ncbi:hypothetical protein [Spirochaeta isovalerica]|uniref:Band 7 domain-containing protein n=1 Tax=Spirochaeta isovalerica TaxID=150 RepID=A0A841R262_9SPIO|nr:hypothetical protein [Spirochaeta isovalerica]MBB6479104.1 hypothetical protein [Spirochaeta isovalerica]
MADTTVKKKKKSSLGPILSFLLFFGAAGTLFWFGWVQFELPENTYAVLFSKTSGYDSKVLEPGRFIWKWERILPTNSKLIKFLVETRSTELEYIGELPSGDLYKSFIPENPDFSYHMTFHISYRLIEERLPELLQKGDLDSGDMESFYNEAEAEYLKILKEGTGDYFTENLSINSSSYGELEIALLEKLKSRYTYLEIRSFVVKYINFPDLELYRTAKDMYAQILERRKNAEIATEKWAIESKVNLDTKIEILTKYGELLSKYPILVDYFALDPESQVLDISNLKDFNYVSGE